MVSGGVVRDMIALAWGACVLAYSSGAEAVDAAHVEQAADRFGRGLLLDAAGLTEAMRRRLQGFVPWGPVELSVGRMSRSIQALANDVDLALLRRRLLIELPGTPPSCALHPAIVGLVPGMALACSGRFALSTSSRANHLIVSLASEQAAGGHGAIGLFRSDPGVPRRTSCLPSSLPVFLSRPGP